MTIIRKLALVTALLAVASFGLLTAGSLSSAGALTLPTTAVTVTVATVPAPLPVPAVPPVTTALPQLPTVPPVATVPPVTSVVTAVPPPPPSVPRVTTASPPRPPATTAGSVTEQLPLPQPQRTSPPVASTSPPPAPSDAHPSTGPSETPGEDATGATGWSPYPAPVDAGSAAVGSPAARSGAVRADAAPRSSVERLRVERPALVLGARGARGAATIVFRLPRGGTVIVTVTQVAPLCRQVGTFRVRGRRGQNRVRWLGRIGDRVLPPGTYRLSPRLVDAQGAAPEPLAAALLGEPVVILPRRTSARVLRDEARLRVLRSRNVCRLEAVSDQEDDPLASLGFAGFVREPAVPSAGGVRAATADAAPFRPAPREHSGLRTPSVDPLVEDNRWRVAAVILLLILVPPVLALALSALPRAALATAHADALARHRDALPLLALGWAMCVALGYFLSILISLLI